MLSLQKKLLILFISSVAFSFPSKNSVDGPSSASGVPYPREKRAPIYVSDDDGGDDGGDGGGDSGGDGGGAEYGGKSGPDLPVVTDNPVPLPGVVSNAGGGSIGDVGPIGKGGDDLDKEEPLSGGKARSVVLDSELWGGGIVYYSLDPALDANEKAAILRGMKRITETTCIKFRQYRTAQIDGPDYVLLKKDPVRCTTGNGRMGGMQTLNVHADCLKLPSIIHYLIHILGLEHVVQAPDRDKYVKINWDNVNEMGKIFLQKQTSYRTFGLPYDFRSMISYRVRSFAVDSGVDVINVISPNGTDDFSTSLRKHYETIMGHPEDLSFGDITKIRMLYHCGGM